MLKNKHQDYIYINKKKFKPKENFKFLLKIIKKYHKKNIKILDLGCAAGDWLYFIKHYYDKKSYFEGVDYSKPLIDDAKKKYNFENMRFKHRKAENYLSNRKFDVVNISGLISYYDNFEKIIECSFINLKKNGILILFDNLNQYNIDVLVRYRHNKKSKKFEQGWNIHSEYTIKKIIRKKKLKYIDSFNFKMPFFLKKTDDPARSWNIRTNEGLLFRNGLAQIYKLKAYIFKK